MSSKFSNKGKERFLAGLPTASLDSESSDLAARCGFNFSYFERQEEGMDFKELTEKELVFLLDKLKGGFNSEVRRS